MFTAFWMEEGICKSYYPADCLGENIMTKGKRNKNITTFDEHIDKRYGKIGTKKEPSLRLKQKRLLSVRLLRRKDDLLQ